MPNDCRCRREINIVRVRHARWCLKIVLNFTMSYKKVESAVKSFDNLHFLYWELGRLSPFVIKLGFFRCHDSFHPLPFLSNLTTFLSKACNSVYLSLQTIQMVEAAEEPGSAQWVAAAFHYIWLLWSLIACHSHWAVEPAGLPPPVWSSCHLLLIWTLLFFPSPFLSHSRQNENLLSTWDMSASKF